MSHAAALPRPTAAATAGGVLADAFGGTRVRDAALVAGGAGLTAALAQVSIPIPPSPVPVTGQTLAVVLAGAALGARRGAASQLLYLLVGLFLPVYAGGDSGAHVVWGSSGGYLFGFVLAAGLVGWAAQRGADRRPLLAALTFAGGQLAVFGIGVPWLKVSADLGWGTAVHYGFTVFVVGGIVKAVVAAGLLPSAWRLARRVR
ncbi:MAG TPA: biotin transporter BioY [Baekduia sp.]|uniref:biotin transporter BioY n=1 Tax=Baekduia sp. TaxID=2600305 RepID=UPI002D781959|nr:biotin transporter BioY [Baekduia sp.]HET6506978.1 biotin transporter BioY [Baekduia sp.]